MAFSKFILISFFLIYITTDVAKAQVDQASMLLMSDVDLEWPTPMSLDEEFDEENGDENEMIMSGRRSLFGKECTSTSRMVLSQPTGSLARLVQVDLTIPTTVTKLELLFILTPEAALKSVVAGVRDLVVRNGFSVVMLEAMTRDILVGCSSSITNLPRHRKRLDRGKIGVGYNRRHRASGKEEIRMIELLKSPVLAPVGRKVTFLLPVPTKSCIDLTRAASLSSLSLKMDSGV